MSQALESVNLSEARLRKACFEYVEACRRVELLVTYLSELEDIEEASPGE